MKLKAEDTQTHASVSLHEMQLTLTEEREDRRRSETLLRDELNFAIRRAERQEEETRALGIRHEEEQKRQSIERDSGLGRESTLLKKLVEQAELFSNATNINNKNVIHTNNIKKKKKGKNISHNQTHTHTHTHDDTESDSSNETVIPDIKTHTHPLKHTHTHTQ
eukprot:GHVR01071901.1.p1 GENE.GHVR01071901.1~~GHVR01071901.1.p1  ORF type:complete len:164 (+),score=91.96 GHVR01071901.1:128-619(+)